MPTLIRLEVLRHTFNHARLLIQMENERNMHTHVIQAHVSQLKDALEVCMDDVTQLEQEMRALLSDAG